MQKLAEVCVARPVFAVMLILCLVVVGAVSYSKLGIDRFPDVDMPLISVRTNLPGASPKRWSPPSPASSKTPAIRN